MDDQMRKTLAWEDLRRVLESRTIDFPGEPATIDVSTPNGLGDAFAHRYFGKSGKIVIDDPVSWDFADIEARMAERKTEMASGDPDPLAGVSDRRFFVVQPETVHAHKLAAGNRHERRRLAKKLRE